MTAGWTGRQGDQKEALYAPTTQPAPFIPATMPEGTVESFGTDTPMGRAGQPAELAPLYVFFASQESSYVTGEVLGATGGKLLS